MKAKSVAEIPLSSIRIGRDLKTYEKTAKGWKRSSQEFPEALQAIKLFKSHGRFAELIDKKDKKFLKGYLYRNEVKGARINILPNGRKLNKAYSLFAPSLAIHDQHSHDHWDVMYKNPNGQYAYVYTFDKVNASKREKYKKVHEFEKIFPKLRRNVAIALRKHEPLALPMETLLNTYIRVGNEIYYKLHKHKGLTTLMKKDVEIKKGFVTFHYLGKDGVPIEICKQFPREYLVQLSSVLKRISNDDYIFTNQQGKILKEKDFKEAFKRYCGKEFYPHIVRSYIATEKAKKFLKSRKSATKQEINALFASIASELGHKRFDKKTEEWKDSYNVTIHHYIQPDLVEKIQGLCG